MTGVNHLFVYGTLLGTLGHPMHQLMQRGGRFVGPATFQGKMFMVGGYPGVLPSADGGDVVVGEVYELDDPAAMLGMLDLYEGCEELMPEYCRTQVTVHLASETPLPAWMYLYNQPTDSFERVRSGDFHRFIQGRHRS